MFFPLQRNPPVTVFGRREAKMEAGESPARSRHCKEGTAVQKAPLRNRFVGRRTVVKISKSGNMHEAAAFTVPEKHRVKFFIGEMQIIRPDKRKRYSENGLQPEEKIHRLQLFDCFFQFPKADFSSKRSNGLA